MSGSAVAEAHPDDDAGHIGQEPQAAAPASEPVTPVAVPAAEETKLAEKPSLTRWEERRLATLTRQRQEAERRAALAERRAAEAEAREAVLRTGQPAPTSAAQPGPNDELQARFDAAVQDEAARRQFDADCNVIYTKGTEQFPDFTTRIQQFQKIGGLQPEMVQVALELGNPHEVLYQLATDLDEAARIAELPPLRMATALTKFVEGKERAKVRQVSKASEPITPLTGTAAPAEKSPEQMTTAEWMVWRKGQIEKAKSVQR